MINECMAVNNPPIEAINGFSARVTADLLNVRQTPDSNGAICSQLKKGTTVGVERYSENEDWSEIITDTGLKGWVMSKFLEEVR